MMNIACQTIVFGDNIKDTFTEIAKTLKEIGYDGIETGARHFYLDRAGFYQDLLGALDMQLIAIHVGGNFLDKDSVRKQLDNVSNIISFSRKLGCSYLYLSGHYYEGKTRNDYADEAVSYTEIGKMCANEGLVLCYHNHDWEFKNKAEGMKALLDNVPAELMKLVPDVGWIEIAGTSSLQFLKDNIDRIEALHFKDFKGPDQFTELGTGIVPFRDLYTYICGLNRRQTKTWWISAEQDRSTLEPQEAARINFTYLDGLRKEIQGG